MAAGRLLLFSPVIPHCMHKSKQVENNKSNLTHIRDTRNMDDNGHSSSPFPGGKSKEEIHPLRLCKRATRLKTYPFAVAFSVSHSSTGNTRKNRRPLLTEGAAAGILQLEDSVGGWSQTFTFYSSRLGCSQAATSSSPAIPHCMH